MNTDYLDELVELIKKEEKPTIESIKHEMSDPITEELCETFLRQYIENGYISSRIAQTKNEKRRGNNTISHSYIASDDFFKSNEESMKEGLKIIINELKKGNYNIMNKVNKIYRSDIIMLYPYLQNYLETGIINDKIKDFLENLYKDCYSIQTMLCSGLKNGHLFNYSNSSIDFRFYINMPINKETILFCRDYQILCQKFDIPYTMKEFKECGEKAKDVTVFYSSLEDLPLKITILKYLIKIYPNMELGSPLIACSSLPDLPYLGFSNNGIQVKKGDGSIKNGVTYADMIQYLFNSILNFFVSNYVLNTEKFSEKTKNKIENLKRNGIIQNSRHVVFNDVLVYNYYTFDGEEREIVKNYIKQCMDNSLKKQVMIQFFMHNIRVAYNANNGFPEDYIPNVAFDTWYINEKLDSITKNETKTSSHPRK